MWGVGLAVVLVASGVVFILLGLQVQQADERVQAATLFKWVPKSSDRAEAFLNCSTFSFAIDAPEYTSFYLWNLTNAQDLLAGGQPKLQQVGPYTYEKRSRKLNVNFHPVQDGAYDSQKYNAVSYQVASTYHFTSERSNGSETDLVVTLNASYVRHLTKLHFLTGKSERFLAAEFAHAHIRDYTRHLQSDFLAATKLRTLRTLLPEMVSTVKREGLTAVINRQRKRVEDASLPATLVRMHAVARTEQIPVMLRDLFRDQADLAIPDLLAKQFALARRRAVPRVLSNMFNRLLVEAVPALLGRQLEAQLVNFVPRTLGSMNLKIQRIAFPYVLQEVFERACLEAVPFILRAIKAEITAMNMAQKATADDAKLAVVNLWRELGSLPTDFDTWIDDSPTTEPRTGFELLPTTSALQLSLEAATILLGSLPSNLRFSLVDYDAAQTAANGLNGPQTTAVGFAIWKQVVALDETAIAYVLDGVNNDVANPADYLTRAQLLAVRDYVINWAQSSTIQRDRQRFWCKAFDKRTSNSDLSDPDVDLDLERVGVQSGFSLQPLLASPSATTVSVDVAQQVWNASIESAFTHPVGFIKWMEVVDGVTTASTSELLAGVTGITSAEIVVISTWIKHLLDDGFVRRRALLHWTDGTCVSALQIPRTNGCLRYDLEPKLAGDQLGFEMNPNAVLEIGSGISESARNTLWDVTQDTASFLMPAHSSDTTKYYGRWLQAIRTSDYKRLIDDSQQLTTLALTQVSAQAIGVWLDGWAHNDLNKLAVYNWWSRSTCYPREQISKTVVGSPGVTSSLSECTETSSELEQSTTSTPANTSPFFTDVRTYQVTEDTCAASGSQFTRTRTVYTLTVRVFSCEMVSTGLADDLDDGTRRFELAPLVQNSADRISLASANVLWNPESRLSFRSTQGYQRWINLAAHISANAASVALEIQGVVYEMNAEITRICQQIFTAGGASSAVFNTTLTATSCTPVTTTHVTRIAAWVDEQSGSTWVKNTLRDQWRRGIAGKLDIEPYRDGLQSGLELTTGCETTLMSLSAAECSSITSENDTKYKVPREALRLWETSHEASFITAKGYLLWDSLASAVESQDATGIETIQKALAILCGSSTWDVWMERVFQWLQRWKTNEHLQRDVLGHWLYASCPTTPTTVAVLSEPAPQTSMVSSCTAAYTATLSPGLDDIQQLASRPVTFFDPNIVQNAALVRPSKTVNVNEAWTKCTLTASSYTKIVGTRQSTKKYQACNLLSILATPEVDPSEVTPIDATFELNRSAPAGISLEVAKDLWNAQSAFSLVDSSAFVKKWYVAIDRSNALQTLQLELDSLVGSSITSDLSVVQSYIKQWESSDSVATIVTTLWTSTKPASVDVDIHEDDDQHGFELFWSSAYKGTTSSLALPTLQQAKVLWKVDSVYSIVRSDSNVDSAGLPTGFRAWEEIYDGVDYESEHLVSQYPLQNQVAQSPMTHALSDQKRAQLLSLMMTRTALSEAQVRGIARWLFDWATDDSLRDFVLAQWALGETFRGGSTLNLDFAAHMKRLFGFLVTSDTERDYFTITSSVLARAGRKSLRKLWDVATTGSILDPASQVAWCLIEVSDSNGDTRTPCAHLLDGYGVLEASAFQEFLALIQPPTIPLTANVSALAIGFLNESLGMTLQQVQVVATWYRGVPESLFSQVFELDEWSNAAEKPSSDPLQFGYELAFVLPWNTSVSRTVAVKDLVANTAIMGTNKVEKAIGECTRSLSLLYTLWDPTNSVSFLHPTGVLTWLSYARGEINELELVGASNPTATVINDQKLADTTVSCLFQLVGHWLKSWSSHPSACMFVEEFWIASITQGSASIAVLLPNASDLVNAFPLQELNSNQANETLFNATDWWVAASRILLDVKESVALINTTDGFALWQTLLVDCFSSDRTTGTCKTPELSSQLQARQTQALAVLSRTLVDRIVTVSSSLSGVEDETLLNYALSMIRSQLVPWMIGLLDHSALEEYLLARVRLANGDKDATTGPTTLVDLAAVQFINGSVTAVNYTVRDSSTGGLLLVDNGTRSERFPREEFVFGANNTIEKQMSNFLPGFSEIRAFCRYSSQDRQFAYDADTFCSFGTHYTLSISDAKTLWSAFGFADTTLWSWPKANTTSSQVPVPSALPSTLRSALLLDAFLAQPFQTTEECEALMVDVIRAYTSNWSSQEKQKICVDRSGETGVGSNAVYLHLPALRNLNEKHVSFVHDMQTYLLYAATKFGYEPTILGLPPSPPQNKSSSLEFPTGGYFATLMVSQILFASGSLSEIPLWPNATTTERGASTFEFLVPFEDDSSLYRKSKSLVGRLLAVDNSTLMNSWGEGVELNTVRVTDGSQFTTAILLGLGENSATSIELPPQSLYLYWGYARRVVQITFDSNVTRFGIPMMRYLVTWSLPERLPTVIVSNTSAPIPSLNMSFLHDDLPLVLQSNPESPLSVVDIDPQTGAVLHRRFAWQLTAAIGDRQALDVWHPALASGWLPMVWIEEEAGISVAASASVLNRGPLTAKTLSLFGVVGGSCVITVGCVLAYVSVRRARLVRLQKRFHSIAPEAATGDTEGLKDAGDQPGEIPAEVMHRMLDRTEGLETEGGKAEDEVRTEVTTRAAWMHRTAK